ncbi:MAG: hypothetical protein AB7S38_13940 [Vulcanimicrobiota bacterium]
MMIMSCGRPTSHQRPLQKVAPPTEASASPIDQVDLDFQTSPAEAPPNHTPKLAALAAGCLGLMAVAAPLAAQAAPPPCSIGIQVPGHEVGQPLGEGQLKEMRQAARGHDFDSPEASQIRKRYASHIDRLEADSKTFTQTTQSLLTRAASLDATGLAEYPDGSRLSRETEGETVRLTARDAKGNLTRLTDTPQFRRLETGNRRQTLYLTDGLMHRQGDFVSERYDGSLTVNPANPTRIESKSVIHGFAGDIIHREIFEKPELSIGVYPSPEFAYRSHYQDQSGKSDKVLTIYSDGSVH